jgi:hypothetical protein
MKLLRVIPSHIPAKKFDAIFETDEGKTKTVPFGSSPHQDYTQSKNKEKRALYRARHAKDLETNDPTRPGYLSMFLLWGDSTNMDTNIKAYKKRFGL